MMRERDIVLRHWSDINTNEAPGASWKIPMNRPFFKFLDISTIFALASLWACGRELVFLFLFWVGGLDGCS